MLNRLSSKRKVFYYLLAAALIGVALIGIITPVYLDNLKEDWENKLQLEIESIESDIQKDFELKQEKLLADLAILTSTIKQKITPGGTDEKLDKLLPSIKFSTPYEILIFDKEDQIIAWTNTPLVNWRVSPDKRFLPNETHFYNSTLAAYLTSYDSIKINREDVYAALYLLVDKKYEINNQYYESINPSGEFSEKYQTPVEISYDPASQSSKDGRIYSFNILNNFNNKIGLIEFQKPPREVSLQQTESKFMYVQALFILLATLFSLLIVFPYIMKTRSKFLKLSLLVIIAAGFRYALYYLNILSVFEGFGIHDSKYFSSLLGEGIVNSPLELFVSLLLFSILSVFIYKESIRYFKNQPSVKIDKYVSPSLRYAGFILSIMFFVLLYFISIRGFGSAVHSMVFDSSLRYFKGISLIPDFPKVFMLVNLLIFVVASFLILAAYILVIIKQLKQISKVKRNFIFPFLVLLFIVFQITGIIYGGMQENPQVSYVIRVLIIFITFLFIWFLITGKVKIYHYFIYAFSASIISILTLNIHNSLLERESLKRTAYELTRQNESLLRFAVYETLVESITNSEVVNIFTGETANPDAAAFKIWSSSILQKESLGCSINFLDNDLTKLGGFKFRFNDLYEGSWERYKDELNELHDIKIISENIFASEDKIIRGIATIENVEGILGFVEVDVIYNISSFGLANTPQFLITDTHYFNETVDYSELSIFDFHNGTLINSQSNYTLREDEILTILNTPLNSYNEAWISLELDDERKDIFILKVEQENINRIIAVALKEKELGLNLFDFFKPFFIHSLVIVLLALIYTTFTLYRAPVFRINFSSKLLISFLFISLIPLLLVAFFFRSLTTEKNNNAIEYKLEKRAASVDEYIKRYMTGSSLQDKVIFEKAATDLGIDFTLFKNDQYFFSVNRQYYNAGLIPKRINPKAKTDLYFNGLNYTLLEEAIEKYKFKSLYYKTSVSGDYYTIKVTDAFNKITIPLSGEEVDVFIFVSYSLAVISILIIGYILTNQLSQPLKGLTNATKLVARGDMNVKVRKKTNDELGELVNGFNFMVDEINKSQAEIAELERETAWKEMARQVAHEIKNPLTPMKLSIQHLIAAYKDKSPKFDGIFNKVTATVINQIETLKNIASEFSGFARMPNPKIEITNLKKIIDEACNLFTDENIVLTGNIDSNIYVEADVDQLRRVFINMIRNSIQAKATQINFDVSKNEKIYIRVSDNGTGIPQNIKDRVFDSSFTTKEKGMGLGLTMAKRTIENLGGTIEVENTSPQGTTLLIKLNVV